MLDWLISGSHVLLQLAQGVGLGVVLMLPCAMIMWWVTRRDRRRWEMRDQLRDMELAIWEESLPDWQREVIQEQRQQQAEIRREARRRLGLPEEERDA
jgi:hypothetical protein